MKTIHPTEILAYYDGVEVFVGQDVIGGHYIGAFIDAVGDFDRYLVVGVKPERLRALRSGMLDLRTLLLDAPGGEWYTTIADGTIDDPLALEPHHEPLAETDYLPDDGFFLLEDAAPTDPADLQQALARGKVANLTGKVEWANRSAGDWGLHTDAGVKSGKIAAGSAALDGLQIGQRYRFRCAVIDERDAFWRHRPAYYLVDFERV